MSNCYNSFDWLGIFFEQATPTTNNKILAYSQTISMVVLYEILYELRKVNFIAQNFITHSQKSFVPSLVGY